MYLFFAPSNNNTMRCIKEGLLVYTGAGESGKSTIVKQMK